MGNNRITLDGRLESYSSAARSSATLATLRQRMGNWPVYAAAAGSAMAMATSASAEIVSVTNPGTSVTLVNQTSRKSAAILWGANTAGNGNPPALVIGGLRPFLGASVFAAGASASGSKIGFIGTAGGNVLSELGPNQKIGSSQSFNKTGGGLLAVRPGETGAPQGWAPSAPGFAGFSFKTSLGNQTDYGWLELEYTTNPANGALETLTLLNGEYDNSGAPIETIETTPEPGTAGLMLLALGAIGVAALRRRKQTAQS